MPSSIHLNSAKSHPWYLLIHVIELYRLIIDIQLKLRLTFLNITSVFSYSLRNYAIILT